MQATAPRRMEYLTRHASALAFAALTVFVVIGLLNRPAGGWHLLPASGAVVALAGGAAMMRVPARLVLPCAAAATAGVVMIAAPRSSNVGWFAVCVLAAWCVLSGGRLADVSYWAGSVLLFGVLWLGVSEDPGWAAWIAGVTFTTVAVVMLRSQLRLVEQLRAAQAGLAERSRTQERNRIARELHDVIAHSLTISLLHVSSARLAVEYEPADAARSLAEAERLCRLSLTEARSVVGLLRSDGGEAVAPVPGIDDVAELVNGFRLAGADIGLLVRGDIGGLPATTGAAVYRILQESLTNAARHAPGSPVRVCLGVDVSEVEASGGDVSGVELTVSSAGPPGQGRGMGLLSMSERADALGGHCTAGPGGDGWMVRAVLPLARVAP